MLNEITFKDVLDCINKEHPIGKANCSIGLFLNEHYEETSKEVDSFVVTKPVVSISTLTEDNEVYYNISFLFQSYNDADYKQMWKFVCNYAGKAKNETLRLENGETLDKMYVLSLSIIPEKYKGKYFVYIQMPYAETFSRSENAFDLSASISFICHDKSFQIMSADDDVIDPLSIEREVEQEILSEI